MFLSPKDYIEKNLGVWIESNSEFREKFNVIEAEVIALDQLDGFMSNIFLGKVILKPKSDPGNENQRSEAVLVKVMKGSHAFRLTSKSYVQCRNEVYMYEKVIPYMKEFVKLHQSTIDTSKWTPNVYHSHYGKVPELSDIDECFLVMENLSVKGFKNGPRQNLDLNHIRIMLKTISEFHAVQFAMKIKEDPMLETLKSGLSTLRWKEESGSEPNWYEIVFPPSFERLFDYLDRHPHIFEKCDAFKSEVDLMRTKFGKDPVEFLELFREDDKDFSIILHGNYNRNNVLFHYDPKEPTKPIGLRMIDFQEVRYATPAIDLFVFLYMSSTKELRNQHWNDLLILYHSGVWNHLKELLQCDDSDPRLEPYSFASFQRHFSRFAFHGILVTIHFLPWMDADPKELEPLAYEFTYDMTSDKCRELMLTVGGDVSNKKVFEALQHAFEMGYLSFIKYL